MAVVDDVRAWWDADAPGYDSVPHHHPTDPAVRAAWNAALARHLPSVPSRILDCGAGTGFLSLTAARLGHRVVALDLSAGMLERLSEKAAREKLDVEVIRGSADDPPDGQFDVVMERHLLWTLPDPVATLSRWRCVAPRLLLAEGIWGGADPVERLRGMARSRVGHMLGEHHGHHAAYPEHLLRAMPLAQRTTPASVARAVEDAAWRAPQIERLHDVEWAMRLALPVTQRVLGVPPIFVVTATA
jgi:SAM-dependent methyltransferase